MVGTAEWVLVFFLEKSVSVLVFPDFIGENSWNPKEFSFKIVLKEGHP